MVQFDLSTGAGLGVEVRLFDPSGVGQPLARRAAKAAKPVRLSAATLVLGIRIVAVG